MTNSALIMLSAHYVATKTAADVQHSLGRVGKHMDPCKFASCNHWLASQIHLSNTAFTTTIVCMPHTRSMLQHRMRLSHKHVICLRWQTASSQLRLAQKSGRIPLELQRCGACHIE